MLKRWLENEPKVTLVCAVVSAVSLVLSIASVLKDVLPVDIAWIAIILCGIPILIGAFKVVKVCSCDNIYSNDDILRFAALVEQKSEHPHCWLCFKNIRGVIFYGIFTWRRYIFG